MFTFSIGKLWPRHCLYCGLFVLALVPRIGQSALYTYVDEQGKAHFASTMLDERYRLLSDELEVPADWVDDAASPVVSSASLAQEIKTPSPVIEGAKQQEQKQEEKKQQEQPQKFEAKQSIGALSRSYDELIEQAAREWGVDAPLIHALITAESAFNARAISNKGAVGLMQIMPATATHYGLSAKNQGLTVAQQLLVPHINIRIGVRYLRDLLRRFGNPELALAAYNAGASTVIRYGYKVPPYSETQNYVRSVMQYLHLYTSGRHRTEDVSKLKPATVPQNIFGDRVKRLRYVLDEHGVWRLILAK